MGYHVRRDAQGRGYATEAAQACLAEARRRGVSDPFSGHHPPRKQRHRVLRERLELRYSRSPRCADRCSGGRRASRRIARGGHRTRG
ncbi:GNAT family N-acetyltransferase [Microbacterium amylolyticum]|uniref:GNAT family N-acetyltransferase n=1 Tax=Microbacterium amylolyticum TaxID=936337 RepID=UPI0030B9D6AF